MVGCGDDLWRAWWWWLCARELKFYELARGCYVISGGTTFGSGVPLPALGGFSHHGGSEARDLRWQPAAKPSLGQSPLQ